MGYAPASRGLACYDPLIRLHPREVGIGVSVFSVWRASEVGSSPVFDTPHRHSSLHLLAPRWGALEIPILKGGENREENTLDSPGHVPANPSIL